ncbi:hypothetical protein SF1_24840 [Sphingobacterium faecium NBRC 15299]|uniref:hypothetical protein n=1 Tax=Sphingobacterium faecium TaxID=34087 RepID=UPI000D3BBA99|nr:hypothetical protein [Sphingobacterium faecium]PTX11629.1 hypothetical protein C8N37_103203 [Sphingobacterium faecium]GEM64502.1 hypothetical protein SF1_24840 [Sphingobacterium faecium NBRC 15299]
MKIKVLTLSLLLQLITLTVFSQTAAGLKSLLNKEAEFIFPQKPANISSILKTETVFYEDANEEKYAKWLTPSGLELFCSIGEDQVIKEMYFDIPDDKFLIIEGLPHNLTMNKTTLQESIAKFNKYRLKKEKLNDGALFSDGTKLTFKKGKHYTTLLFDNNNLLKFISLSNELIDPAAN